MSLKTRHELSYLRRTRSGRADDKRREHEDWLVLLGFNHLFAGLEAYVSGHLTDFPGDLHFQALPDGVGASISVPFRVR
jgi:FKBP-type peptidyl-prolyl cis-trans isomerase 2